MPRFLLQPGKDVEKTLQASQRIPYELAPKPDVVSTVTDSSPWSPSISLTRPGKLFLVFDDRPGTVNQRFEAVATNTVRQYKLKDSISMSDFKDGGYYRYHYEGTSLGGDETLADQGTTYILHKDTTATLQRDIELYSSGDTIHITIGLSRRISPVLQFPNTRYLLKPQTETNPGPLLFVYDFEIPADIEKAVDSQLKASLQTVASTDPSKPTSLLELKLLDGTSGNNEIAALKLNLVNLNATKLLASISAQQKLGLSKTQAQTVAKQALGVQSPSPGQETDAVNFLSGILQNKDTNKNKLLAFLVMAGKVAASYYGIPVPTTTKSK